MLAYCGWMASRDKFLYIIIDYGSAMAGVVTFHAPACFAGTPPVHGVYWAGCSFRFLPHSSRYGRSSFTATSITMTYITLSK